LLNDGEETELNFCWREKVLIQAWFLTRIVRAGLSAIRTLPHFRVLSGLPVTRQEQFQSHERPATCRLRVSNSKIAQTADAGMPIILAISMSIRGVLVLIDS
jgi:hypothetical protein